MDKKQLVNILESIRDERTKGANTARRIGNAFLSLLEYASTTNDEKLSSVHDDIARGLITFANGLVSSRIAQLYEGASFGKNGASINQLGEALLNSIRSVEHNNTAQQGFCIQKDQDGKYHEFITNLTVWGKAIFHELEIRKLSYSGGNIYLSGAGSKIVHVEDVFDADHTLIGWRCYLLADDGTTATQNMWQVKDQVRCQTFNIANGIHDGIGNKGYWRLVTEVSEDNVPITTTITTDDGTKQTVELYDGKKFAYIVLAKDNCMDGSDIPAEGDTIVLDGNQDANQEDRQGVLILESTGKGSPRIVAYAGIDNYTHEGKEVFYLSASGCKIVSNRFELTTPTGDAIHIVNYRGQWQQGTQYGYYDQVNHQNALWTCTNTQGTMAEPSDTSPDWVKVLSGEKGDKGDDAYSVQITSDLGNVILNGEGSRTLTAHVYRGADEITDTLTEGAFSWWRTSADPEDDALWNQRHLAMGHVLVVSKEDVTRSAVFGCDIEI